MAGGSFLFPVIAFVTLRPGTIITLWNYIVLGLHAVRHYELMLGKELRELYNMYLTSTDVSERLCCQVLKNIQTYLTEEEVRMIKADHECKSMCKIE